MVVNISTNRPVFHVRGLSSGTEYRVKIYSVNDSGGVSEHAVFQTFTLQVWKTIHMINLEFRLLCKTFERKGLNKKQNWETQYDLPQETTSRKKLHWQQQQPQPPPVRKEATVFCPSFTSEWCIKKLEPLPWLGVEQKLFIRQSSMMRLHYKFLDRSGDHQAGGELVKSSNILHHPSCGLVPVFCRARIWDKVLANIGWNLTCKASFLHLLWHYTTYS